MWAVLLFAIGSTALGLLLWRLAWRYLRLRRAMRGWPRVPAEVMGYRTELGRSSRRVDVEVRYQYNGQTRQVWCGSPTRSSYGRDAPQASAQVAAKFPRGSRQQVFVNPATPDEAFLELPEPHMLAMLIGGGTMLVALPLALMMPAIFGVDEEIVKLAFMLLFAVVLAVIAVFTGIALWRTPRPRWPRRSLVPRRGRASRPRPKVRPWRL